MDRSTQESLLEAATQADSGAQMPRRGAASGWGQSEPREPTSHERLARLMRTLEADIIPRLVRTHRAAPEVGLPPAEQVLPLAAAEVQHFARLAIGHDASAIGQMIGDLRARGLKVESIYIDLLAPAARCLGEWWEDDRCSFADVTVGLGRLQQAMRELSPAFGSEVDHPADGRRALLVPAPSEQHTFGLSMVAEFFRRAGWDVVGGVGEQMLAPPTLVRSEWFDVIGISVGVDSRLDWLKEGIAAVRQASCNRGIGVMVGGPLFSLNPGLAVEVGADATAADGRHAPIVAESLLEQRAARL